MAPRPGESILRSSGHSGGRHESDVNLPGARIRCRGGWKAMSQRTNSLRYRKRQLCKNSVRQLLHRSPPSSQLAGSWSHGQAFSAQAVIEASPLPFSACVITFNAGLYACTLANASARDTLLDKTPGSDGCVALACRPFCFWLLVPFFVDCLLPPPIYPPRTFYLFPSPP